MSQIKRPTLDEYARFGANSGLDRRQLMNLVGEFGLAAIAAACSGSPSAGPSEISSPSTPPSPAPGPAPEPNPLAPIISNATPNGFTFPAGARSTVLRASTDLESIMKYSANPNTPWEDMPDTFSTTGGTSHSTTVGGLQDGRSFTYYIRAKNPATGAANLTDTVISFSVASPAPPSAVEYEIPVVGLLTGRSAGSGTFSIPSRNLNIPFNGRIKVTKEMGLLPGKYAAVIKTDIGEDRYLSADVSSTGMSVDLGGGRTETTLNVIEKGVVDQQDLARYILRNGVSHRSVTPLKIGLLDQYLYSVDAATGNLIRRDQTTMNGSTRADLDKILRNLNGRNDPAFWGLYPTGDLLGTDFYKVQSRGDIIPENERTNGWLITYAYREIVQGANIERGDNGINGGGPEIRWAFMRFRPGATIPEISWVRDMRECFGWAQLRDSAEQTQTMSNYKKIKFERLPGWKPSDG